MFLFLLKNFSVTTWLNLLFIESMKFWKHEIINI